MAGTLEQLFTDKAAYKTVLFIYGVHQAVVFLVVYLSHTIFAFPGAPRTFYGVVANNMAHWDGRWYLYIAETGYDVKSAAFFPLYPAMIRLLKGLAVDPLIGGLLISNLSLFVICFMFYRLVSLDYDEQVSTRALWYLVLFPTSFYFSVLYSESLFLALVLLAFYAARTKRWFWAGVFGMTAGLTRNLGVLLLIPLVYEYLADIKFQLRQVKPDILWLGLVPVGPAVFMAYLWRVLGNPLAFLDAQKFWHRTFAFPWQSFYRACDNVVKGVQPGRNFLDLIFTVIVVLLIILAVRKTRFSYLLYMLIGAALPLTSSAPHAGLYSMPRLILVLFPMYIVMADRVKNRTLISFIYVLFTGTLIYFSVIFSYSCWVA